MKTIGRIIILLLLPLTALEVNAQDDLYMNIIQTDGSVIRVPVNDIQEVKIDKASYNPRPMSIKVSSEALEDNAQAAGAMRKIPPTTTNTLNKFYLNYVYDNGNVVVGEPELYTDNVEEGEWLVSTTTYPGTGGWPDTAPNNTLVTFYAYANVDVDTEDNINNLFDSDGPCISFGMDEYTRELNDLLVAQATDSWDNCGGHLFLPFEHACAALEFYISKTSSLADYTVSVNNVKIHNVPSVGVYYFNSGEGEWDVCTDSECLKEYTVYAMNNDAITVKKDADGKDLLIGEGDYMFVIPQTLTPWDKTGLTLNPTGTYIEITCKISKEGEYVVGGEGEDEDDWGKAYLPFEATLTKGKIHPFTIKMGTALRDASGNKIFQ